MRKAHPSPPPASNCSNTPETTVNGATGGIGRLSTDGAHSPPIEAGADSVGRLPLTRATYRPPVEFADDKTVLGNQAQRQSEQMLPAGGLAALMARNYRASRASLIWSCRRCRYSSICGSTLQDEVPDGPIAAETIDWRKQKRVIAQHSTMLTHSPSGQPALPISTSITAQGTQPVSASYHLDPEKHSPASEVTIPMDTANTESGNSYTTALKPKPAPMDPCGASISRQAIDGQLLLNEGQDQNWACGMAARPVNATAISSSELLTASSVSAPASPPFGN